MRIETLNLQLSIYVLSIVEYGLKYISNLRDCFELERRFSIEGHNVGVRISATSRQEFYPSPSASTTKVDIVTSAIRAFPTAFWEITPKSELRGKMDN